MSIAAPVSTQGHHLIDTIHGIQLRRKDGSIVQTLPPGALMRDAYKLADKDSQKAPHNRIGEYR